jgi:hypothetical protein
VNVNTRVMYTHACLFSSHSGENCPDVNAHKPQKRVATRVFAQRDADRKATMVRIAWNPWPSNERGVAVFSAWTARVRRLRHSHCFF